MSSLYDRPFASDIFDQADARGTLVLVRRGDTALTKSNAAAMQLTAKTHWSGIGTRTQVNFDPRLRATKLLETSSLLRRAPQPDCAPSGKPGFSPFVSSSLTYFRPLGLSYLPLA